MAYLEAWVEYSGPHGIKYPKEFSEFEGYVIAQFTVLDDPVAGRNGKSMLKHVKRGSMILIKGEVPSMHPCFAFRLRFKRLPGYVEYAGEYEILPKTGFLGMKRLPWIRAKLIWALRNELKMVLPDQADKQVAALGAPPDCEMYEDNPEELSDEKLSESLECYKELVLFSDVYRMEHLLISRIAWPRNIAKLRELNGNQIAHLGALLKETPHMFSFYPYSKQYGLPEVSFVRLKEILTALKDDDIKHKTSPVQVAAVALYCYIKDMRENRGHTRFDLKRTMSGFKSKYSQDHGKIADAALNWLTKEGHLVYIDDRGLYVPKERWFIDNSPVCAIQLPRDDLLKERILGHLRRIYVNFLKNDGLFTLRPVDNYVTAVPGGPLNAKQRIALDHIMNNPITIIQGGPGSGKTFMGIDHLVALFHWPEITTHVGRQAVSLCDRLGGHPDVATTIHSAHYRLKQSPLKVAYCKQKQILIADEVYNADEQTLEWLLALAPEASRVVFIGDPDQIRPIAGENGAGTPALDIARAFGRHVITLDQNMRQQAAAIAIHKVVLAVKNKQPRSIEWKTDVEDPTAVAVMMGLPYGNANVREQIYKMIKRLRADIDGDEHAWQMISFYNGRHPDRHGLGINQLNEMVEEYLDDEEEERMSVSHIAATTRLNRVAIARRRTKFNINSRLKMYIGFKFMLTERYIADRDINDMVLGAKNKGKFGETCNGQIEVVKRIRTVQIKGAHPNSKSWLVECELRGKCTEPTRLLINKKLHVDPRGIVPAWVTTTNKSMGGECTNVGVFIPDEITKSPFDRTNIYVGVSRATRFMTVMGNRNSFEWLVMRDPPFIDTGLYYRLKSATVAPIEFGDDEEQKDCPLSKLDWKMVHDQSVHYINDGIRERMDIYDQSDREAFDVPMAPCETSFSMFLANERQVMKNMTKEEKQDRYDTIMTEYKSRLYEGVPDHTKKVPRLDGAINVKKGKYDMEDEEIVEVTKKQKLVTKAVTTLEDEQYSYSDDEGDYESDDDESDRENDGEEEEEEKQPKTMFSVLLKQGRANMKKEEEKLRKKKEKQQERKKKKKREDDDDMDDLQIASPMFNGHSRKTKKINGYFTGVTAMEEGGDDDEEE